MTEVTSSRLLAPADRLVTLPAGLPARTLGWEAVRFAATYLKHPDGPRAGQRWEYVESQVRFLLWYYALDENGRWLYSHAVRRLAKGAGKSPSAGSVGITEFCAPVRLDHFDDDAPGGCVGKQVSMPLVQIAATSESQTANTMRVIRAVTVKGSRLVRDFDIDVGKTVMYRPGGGQLEVITSSAAAAEGALPTFQVWDEALALDTPIPTPSGWTAVGEIQLGDQILGRDGLPHAVTKTTEVFHGRPCYRVTFKDGTSIVADAGHKWLTDVVSAAKPQVRTTAEIVAAGRPMRVPRPEPIQFPHADLLLHPYVLGVWLGDGNARTSGISCGLADVDSMLSILQATGEFAHIQSKTEALATLHVGADPNRCPRGHQDWVDRPNIVGTVRLLSRRCCVCERDRSDPIINRSLRGRLVTLGVLGNKNIPPIYLRASVGQRLALLQGLMDSDGYINAESGAATFVNTNWNIASGVAELVRSLGVFASMSRRNDPRKASYKTVHKVSFRPDVTLVPFRLPRKARLVRPAVRKAWTRIASIEPVESVPVKCIAVDAPDHLFVAGDGWIATHNTEHWRAANGGVELSHVLARNLAKTSSRAIETCNAWEPGAGSVAETTYDAWIAQEEGRTLGGARTLYDARVAPPDTDLADDESLRAGIAHAYGDCWWVDQETIRNSLLDPRTPVDVGRRFYLNQPVASMDAWATPQEWAAIADPAQVMADVSDGDEIVAFFDGSRTRDATALLACHVESGGVFAIEVWEPPTGMSHSAGATYEVPVDEVDAAVARMFDRWDVRAFFADVREWESFTKVEWPKRYADQLEIWAVPGGKEPQPVAWDMRVKTYDFTMSCELTLTEIQERAFRHDGDSRVGRHVVNARRHPNRWGVSIAKESRDSPKKIDAAVCMVGARMARRLLLAKRAAEPVKTPRSGRVHGFA